MILVKNDEGRFYSRPTPEAQEPLMGLYRGGLNPKYDQKKWGFKAKELGGLSGWKTTKRTRQGEGGFWVHDVTGFLLTAAQAGRTSPGGRAGGREPRQISRAGEAG